MYCVCVWFVLFGGGLDIFVAVMLVAFAVLFGFCSCFGLVVLLLSILQNLLGLVIGFLFWLFGWLC